MLTQVNAGDKASAIFGDLDIDGNGEVDEEEFIRYQSFLAYQIRYSD